MSKSNRQAGQNIRKLALSRRIRSISYLITAFFVFCISLFAILNFQLSPLFYLLFIVLALGLILKGSFWWKRANHADQGAKGEEDIAQEIAQLEKLGWHIEYGIPLGNRLGDLDIFCTSSQGRAYAIDVKSHKGEVIADGKELYRRMGNKNYSFEKNFLKQTMKQALMVKKQKDLRFVTPIVAFSNARVSIQGDKLQNVYLVEKSKLVSLLKSLG